MKNATHALVSDDDGHHYVIPRGKEDEFQAWLEAVRAYWSCGYVDDIVDSPPPHEPSWLDAIGGSPSLVEFHAEGYSIGGEKRA